MRDNRSLFLLAACRNCDKPQEAKGLVEEISRGNPRAQVTRIVQDLLEELEEMPAK
jgi:hypothetical protein